MNILIHESAIRTFPLQFTVTYKGVDDTHLVEYAEMKEEKIEENNAINTRLLETRDKKQVKEEFLELIRNERAAEEGELLDRMLRFLAEVPVDKYHDYRTFKHTGLREYLINRFLREKLSEELSRYS
jgi:hypothetical protein